MTLGFGEIWRATFAAVARERSLYLTIAAAFVLLPTVAAAVLGPPEPRNFGEMRGATLAVQGLVALIGAVAQLAIARLAWTGGTVGEALGRAAMALPALIAATLLTVTALIPAGVLIQLSQRGIPALLLPGLGVLIPGLWVAARLALTLPIVAARGVGPIAALRQSWAATASNGWRILGLLAALLGVLLGALLLASGVAAAAGSVLTLLGGKALAGFLVTLVAGAVGSVYTVYNSVLLATIARRLIG